MHVCISNHSFNMLALRSTRVSLHYSSNNIDPSIINCFLALLNIFKDIGFSIGLYLKKIFLMILQIFSDCCQKLSQFGPLYPSPQNSYFPMSKIVSLDWNQNHQNECRPDKAVVVLNEMIKSHLKFRFCIYVRFVYFNFSKFSIGYLTILKKNHLPSYVTGQRSSNCSW